MNDPTIIEKLKKFAEIFEAYEKTSYLCYRKTKNGGTQEVEVTILDGGPSVDPGLRYHCYAVSKDGRAASGNPADSIDVVLAILHWFDLDK